jgi:flagellar protein FliS
MTVYTQQYQQNQILTASPEQILVMLYDGAIRFVRQAKMGIEAGDRGQMSDGISRCMAIVTEFANTLDHEIGGEIAANLDGLYSFMIRELTQANLHIDGKKLTVVEGLLLDLRGTWVEAIEVARAEKAASAAQQSQSVTPPVQQTAMNKAAAHPELPANYKPLSAAG